MIIENSQEALWGIFLSYGKWLNRGEGAQRLKQARAMYQCSRSSAPRHQLAKPASLTCHLSLIKEGIKSSVISALTQRSRQRYRKARANRRHRAKCGLVLLYRYEWQCWHQSCDSADA